MTKQDWKAWARDPVTHAFVQLLRARRADAMETWAQAGYTGETAEDTMRLNTVALAGVDMLAQVVALIDEQGEDDAATE